LTVPAAPPRLAPTGSYAMGEGTMDTTVTAAVIGAIGAVVAATLALMKKSKSQTPPPPQPSTNIGGGIEAEGDVIGAGHDVIQRVLEDRFISKQGARLISEVSKTIISDESVRWEWSSLDAKILGHCVKDTPRGMIFDSEAFQPYRKPENDRFFDLSVQVYLACSKRVGEKDKDYAAFNKLAQIYLTARVSMR